MKKFFKNFIFVLIFIAGLSLLLYPYISNKWNAYRQSKLITEYDEAIEEMELLGHSFYVFLEAKSGAIQILYQRNDGDLGLIQPEV